MNGTRRMVIFSTSTHRRAFLPLLALSLATPASAQNYNGAPVTGVTLADYKFTPSTVRLRAGKPIILRLSNLADQAHEFAAPEFFANAAIRPSDAKSVNKAGEAEIEPHKRVDIGLVPKTGTYHLQCNKPGHAQLGMQGTIIIIVK
jgi:uncharacterized cupredoxin-like copper-binding protein